MSWLKEGDIIIGAYSRLFGFRPLACPICKKEMRVDSARQQATGYYYHDECWLRAKKELEG